MHRSAAPERGSAVSTVSVETFVRSLSLHLVGIMQVVGSTN